jgi:hypothetical protein
VSVASNCSLMSGDSAGSHLCVPSLNDSFSASASVIDIVVYPCGGTFSSAEGIVFVVR